MEEEGILEYVNVLECPLGLIPLEQDLYSMEDDKMFCSLYLAKDTAPLSNIVTTLLQLQTLSGHIPEIHGQGKYAKIVADKLDQAYLLSSDKKTTNTKNLNSQEDVNRLSKSTFTDIYLIDRDTDYASILLSQLNYEGIIDESFNICCCKIEVETKVSKTTEKTVVKHSLTSENDPIYRHIRDNHFSTVFSCLKNKNHEMKEKYSKGQDMNLSNLKNFVANELKSLQTEFKCLALHISACEKIMNERNKYDFGEQLRVEQNILEGVDTKKCLSYLDKMILHQLNPHVPLRLLALLSLVQGGLPTRDYYRYLTIYCQNFGPVNMITFQHLKKLGLITELNLSLNMLTNNLKSSSSNNSINGLSLNTNQNTTTNRASSTFAATLTGAMSSLTEAASNKVAAAVSSSVLPRRGNFINVLKKFQLVPDVGETGYNIREPTDCAFVFGGAYIPLVCQLVDRFVLPARKNQNQSNLNSIELMKLLSGPNFRRKHPLLYESSITSSPDRVILVFFIGGVTYAEMTALRFLAKQRCIKIAVAATSIINGNRLMTSLVPKIADRVS